MKIERNLGDLLAELSPDEQVLAMLLLEQGDPVGARVAQRLLGEVEVMLSEASVSRMLLRLDQLGLTRSIGQKGRVLTPLGKRVMHVRAKHLQQQQNFERALDLRSVDEVLDWLRARRLLESEAAYLAALRIDEEEMERLESALEKHELSIRGGTLVEDGSGMDIHREISSGIDSPVFEALIESLAAPNLTTLERTLDVITVNRGTADVYLAEHRQVVDAIRRREPEEARAIMQGHFERLERDVRVYCNEYFITRLIGADGGMVV